MRHIFSFLFSFLFCFQAFAGILGKSTDGVLWGNIERFQVPPGQLTKLADKQYLIETGNGNRLKNPNFLADGVATGWTVTTATAVADDTFYFTPYKSLQLTLPTGTQTNLVFLSQTYTANSGDLAGSNLEVRVRIAKSLFQSTVDMKLCLDVDSVNVNCESIPATTSATYFTKFYFNYPAKQSSAPVAYKVYLKASYTTGSTAAIINVQDFYLGPATNIGDITPPSRYTAIVSSASGASTLTGTPDWVSCTSTSPSVCTFKTSLFNSAPSCGTNTTSTTSTNTSTSGTASTTGVTVYFNGATTVKLTCDKTGQDQSFPAVNMSLNQGSYSGTLSGSGQWTMTSTSFADFGAGSGVSLTKLNGTNLQCSAISGNLPGVTCVTARPGLYDVCVNATAYGSSAGSTNGLRLVDGSGTVINSGSAIQDASAGYAQTYSLCGIVSADSNTFSVKIQGYVTAGTLTMNASTATYRPTFRITPVMTSTSNAVIAGGVFSKDLNTSYNYLNVIMFDIHKSSGACSSSPCDVVNKTNSGVTVTRSGTGVYPASWAAGKFSPYISCFVNNLNSTANKCIAGPISSTGATISCTVASSGAAVDEYIQVLCVGLGQ